MKTFMWAAPLMVFTVFASALSLIDARRHVLPNRLVLATLVTTIGTEVAIAGASHQGALLVQSLLVGLETLVVYTCLLVASRGQLGMGDVKYSFITGLIIGWVAPQMWLACIWLAFTLAALWVLITMTQGHRTASTYIAFGPFMSIAAVLCAFAGRLNL